MTAALTAALRACAAGFYPSEAGTGLLISHGGFLDRPGFGAFIHVGTSISDSITEMAEIDWHAAVAALSQGASMTGVVIFDYQDQSAGWSGVGVELA